MCIVCSANAVRRQQTELVIYLHSRQDKQQIDDRVDFCTVGEGKAQFSNNSEMN